MKAGSEKKPFTPTVLTLIFVLMASMLTLMGGAAVAPALPLISIAFPESSETVISLIITIPSLAIVLLGSIIGRIADRIGKVRTLIISLAIFTVAGVSGFFLNSIESIIVGRFILGIGLGGISLSTTALIAEYYTGMARIKVVSYQAAAMGVGVFILEFAGGSLAGIGWREPFLIYLIGIVIVLGIVFFLREPTRNVISIESAPAAEKIESDKRGILLCYITIFLGLFMSFLLPTKFPYYLGEMGASAALSGLFLGLFGVVQAAFCIMYRRIAEVLDRIQILMAAFLLIGLGYCALSFADSYITVIPGLMIAGAGTGLITPTVVNWLASIVTSGTSGRIMGGYSASLNLGCFASSIVIAPVLMIVSGYSQMYLVIGLAAMLTAFAYHVLRVRTGKPAV